MLFARAFGTLINNNTKQNLFALKYLSFRRNKIVGKIFFVVVCDMCDMNESKLPQNKFTI